MLPSLYNFENLYKCFTPITNATSPCRFTDTFETNGQAVLDCSNVVDGPYPNIGFIVPGRVPDSRIPNDSYSSDGCWRQKVVISVAVIKRLNPI